LQFGEAGQKFIAGDGVPNPATIELVGGVIVIKVTTKWGVITNTYK
jgi:hypothetical protein